MTNGQIVLAVLAVAAVGGGFAAKRFIVDNPRGATVAAAAETSPTRGSDDDADDIAIWVDPTAARKHLLLSVDKTHGVLVYDLSGKELEFSALPGANNVDLRDKVKFGEREITLVAVGDTKRHEVVLFELSPVAPHLRPLKEGNFRVGVSASGLALHRHPTTGEASLFVIGKERTDAQDADLDAKLAAQDKVGGKKAAKAPKPEKAAANAAAAKADPATSDASKTGAPDEKPRGRKERKGKGAKAREKVVAGETATATDEKVAVAAEKPADAPPPAPGDKPADATAAAPQAGAPAAAPDGKIDAAEVAAKLKAASKKKSKEWYAVQLSLTADADGTVRPIETRRIRLADQAEGAVCDDDAHTLYVCEEKLGVIKFKTDGAPGAIDPGEMIAKVGFPNPLRDDVEGIAVVKNASGGAGYLVVSSQGSNDFVVLRREAPHDYVGRFKVGPGANVDGAEDTDGIDVIGADLGAPFGSGMLVVQDEYNESATGELVNQNYKLVPWSAVLEALQL